MLKKAFTLVELIVVITILAILSTIAFISLSWYQVDARDAKRASDIKSLETKLIADIDESLCISDPIGPEEPWFT